MRVEEHRRLGIKLGDVKQALNEPKATSHQHSACGKLRATYLNPCSVICGAAPTLTTEHTPRCSADLCDGERTAGIDVADDALGSVVDDSLGSDHQCRCRYG